MDSRVDEALIGRLPLPLARLYRLAYLARTPLEQHAYAVYLWEAALKLLGSVAVIEYLARREPDPGVQEQLAQLARPSLGRWANPILQLVPLLAEGDPHFGLVHGLLRDGGQQGLSKAQALVATMREEEGRPTSRVGLPRLFDELVAYRNRELGHGLTGQRPNEFYVRMTGALLAAATELLGQLDVLAGRRLVYLVRRGGSGGGTERFELVGEVPVPLGPLELSSEETGDPPPADELYLVVPEDYPAACRFFCLRGWLPLAPLVRYDPETGEVFFFHRSRGSRPAEYLSFTTGRYTSFPHRQGTAVPGLAELLDLQNSEESPAQTEPVPAAEPRVLSLDDTACPVPAERGAGEPATGAGFAQPGEPPTGAGGGVLSRLGEYEVRSSLGSGGLGTVFRGWQPMLERPVAIKILPAELATHGPARERFLRECRILGRARHPSLVQIYGSGEAGDGLYYAMEWIEGAPLQVRWEALQQTGLESLRGRPWLAQSVEWLRQIAGAAHALHEAGFVHRNLSPANVLVTADGRRAVLVGLGIAKEGVNEGGLTHPGAIVGTLAYMSPEQAHGLERIDGRVDVYALGVLLWELLTLRRLVAGPNAIEVLFRVLHQEAEPATKYNPHAPRDLVAVCAKCLRKHPDQRYPSADLLAEDLGRFLAGRAVTARPQSLLERLVGWIKEPWREKEVVAGPGLVPFPPALAAEPPPAADVPDTREARLAARPGFRHQPGEPPARVSDPVFSSQMVVTLYPAPIAFAYRRFYQETDPRSRLDALFCVMEASVRYLLALGLSDLFRSLARPDRIGATLPDNPTFDFLRRRRPVSLGTWVDALIETARALEAESPVIEELPGLCRPGGPFVENLLRPLVRWRNDCAHPDGTIRVSAEECKGVLREYRPRLEEALREARFVCQYPLGFVSPFTSMPAGSGQRYYHLHACMGAWVRETSRAMDIKTDLELRPDLPFVVAPDGGRLLYLWPLLLQRRSAYTGRRTLWAFEEISEDKGRFLTRARWSAIDGREDHSDKLHSEPATNHTWLLQRLGELPPAVEVPPRLGLAEKLFPTRSGKLVGQEVGSNLLLAVVAVGGFGTIYAAEATDGERVAVKVIESRLADTELARFRQEFDKLRLAAEHPGVVRCFEYGDVEVDGRVSPWYSMEFALGGDLRARIDKRKSLLRGSLPWFDPATQRAVCSEFVELATAVAHLHRLGFVHRDLKPGNVLIMEDGGLRLTDFGLVKNLQPSEQTLRHGPHTTTGGGAGTPGYMSPEQARGQDVDQRADVYSLGILLAELAVGGRPQADLLGEPGQSRRGSTLRRCVAVKKLPRMLCALIERCTDADPECRPADAGALLEEFRALAETTVSN